MVVRTIASARLAGLLGDLDGPGPIYGELITRLRLLIADGRVPYGTRLPSERALTLALGVSRTTVTRAYAGLRERGYVVSQRGSGSVASVPGDPIGGASGSPAGPLVPGVAPDGVLDLTCAAPAAPAGMLEVYEAALERLPAYLAGPGYHPAGLPDVRAALADDFTARGVPTDPEQIVVTSGGLAALALICRVCLGHGDRALAESPTYPNAIAAMRAAGARVVPLPMEPAGWDTDALTSALRQTAPRMALLIPDFHNPTGLLMPADQRAAIGAELARTRTTGVVDETLVSVVLDDIPTPAPFAAYNRDALTIGSASKAWWGGLRVGWIRAPRARVSALIEARICLDLAPPVLEQLVLLLLLSEGTAIRQERRAQLVASRRALTEAVAEHLPRWRVRVPAGGLSLWCELPEPVSSAIAAAAEPRGVLLAGGSRFAVEGELERYLRLPFTLPADELTDAVHRIAAAEVAVGAHGGRAGTRHDPVVV